VDPDADVDVAAAVGASAALHISDIPFNGPTAACRMGRIQGQYVINPTWSQIDTQQTDMEVLIAGTKNAIMMVEGGAREVPEEDLLEAIIRGHQEIKKVIETVEELRKLCGRPKRQFTPVTLPSDVKSKVEAQAKDALQKALKTKEKSVRKDKITEAKKCGSHRCSSRKSF